MTEDTRRALEIIKPIAEQLNIKVSADECLLYVDDPYEGEFAVGIGCNSTYATLMEFIGLLVLRHARDRMWDIGGRQAKTVKRYWISQEALNKMRGIADDAE